MALRDIVRIDQEKCDGCGLCVPACEEGAIEIVDGKARVVSDILCDGLGACLGHCPRGAISVVQREAKDFDERAVERRRAATVAHAPASTCQTGCPGTAPLQLRSAGAVQRAATQSPTADRLPSQLANWPVQLHLVPPHAPFLQQADLLLIADCVPFACAQFHGYVLDGRPVVIGCPKLDDCDFYVMKLAAIIQQARIRSISVVHMEVPCCTGLLRVAQAAIGQAGVSIPLHSRVVTRRGELFERPVPHPTVSGSPPVRQLAVQLPIA